MGRVLITGQCARASEPRACGASSATAARWRCSTATEAARGQPAEVGTHVRRRSISESLGAACRRSRRRRSAGSTSSSPPPASPARTRWRDTDPAEWDRVLDVNLTRRVPRLPRGDPAPARRRRRRDRQHRVAARPRRRASPAAAYCASKAGGHRADAARWRSTTPPRASASTASARARRTRRCSSRTSAAAADPAAERKVYEAMQLHGAPRHGRRSRRRRGLPGRSPARARRSGTALVVDGGYIIR